MKHISKIMGALLISTTLLSPSPLVASGEVKKISGDMDLKNLFVELGKRANPAVVNIFTTQVVRNQFGNNGPYRGMPMDPFQQFMEEFMNGGEGGGRPMPQQEQKAASLGSGFIIDDSGLIVTNNHVVQNASEIQVQLIERSKKTYKAKIIGKDERSDIALIKINYDGGKLPTLPLGDSEKVEVGEWVAAFGNPFGHGHTMTKGIISAKERDVDVENAPAFPFLQTDASINPGNSGGPLVNSSGEVIGVNSAIDARAQGIGFAIPINVVKKLLPDLKSKGRFIRGFLGVSIVNINEAMMKEFKLKNDKGALVTSIVPGSPADTAGIKPYDIITEYGGKQIEDARQLMNMVSEAKVGESLSTQLIRDGKSIRLSVKILERNEQALAKAAQKESKKEFEKRIQAPHQIGLSLADLNPALARQLDLPPQLNKGVMVIEVQEDSIADEAGIRPGDILLDVNKKKISSAKDALKFFQKGRNSLRILRGGATMLFFMEGQ